MQIVHCKKNTVIEPLREKEMMVEKKRAMNRRRKFIICLQSFQVTLLSILADSKAYTYSSRFFVLEFLSHSLIDLRASFCFLSFPPSFILQF